MLIENDKTSSVKNCLQHLVQDCLRKRIFICNSEKIFCKLHFLHILAFEKTRWLLKLLFRANELPQRPNLKFIPRKELFQS